MELIAVPLSVSENGTSYAPVAYRNEPVAEAAASDSAEVAVSTGELTITAQVTVVYEMIAKQG